MGELSSYLRGQCRLQRLRFAHRDWKIIVFSPWLPPAWTFQWLFLAYRWLLALYFGGWLLYYAITVWGQGGRFMIYLSNWGYLIWMAYLLSAAVAVTLNFIRAWTCPQVVYFPRQRSTSPETRPDPHNASGRCSCRGVTDHTNFCDKLTWFLYLIGGEVAVLIAILFWTTQYSTSGATGPVSFHLHLINAVAALVDLWISGVPVYLLHFVYIQLFAATYVSFTGVYYTFNDTMAIYPVLDYHSNPGLAAGLVVGVVLFGAVFVHILFLAQYLCRRRATSHLLNRYKRKYRLFFSTSSTVHNIVTREPSGSPPPSSSSSSPSGGSLCSDTTPILIDKHKQHSTHSSHESFF